MKSGEADQVARIEDVDKNLKPWQEKYGGEDRKDVKISNTGQEQDP